MIELRAYPVMNRTSGHRQQRLKIIESFSEFGCRQRLFAQLHAPDSNGNPARKSVGILLRELEGVLGRLASAGRTAANALRGTAGRTEQESEPNPLKVNHRHRANGDLRATG
jgi:hypothetical protein